MWRYENLRGELYHYGVKGMHWGVRKYQNSDGSLTRRGHKKVQKTIKKINRRQGLMDARQNVDALGYAGRYTKSAKMLSDHSFKNTMLMGSLAGIVVTNHQIKNAQQYVARKIQYLADKGITLRQFTDTNMSTKERFTTYF